LTTDWLIGTCRILAQKGRTIRAPKFVRRLDDVDDRAQSQEAERVELATLIRLKQCISDELTLNRQYDWIIIYPVNLIAAMLRPSAALAVRVALLVTVRVALLVAVRVALLVAVRLALVVVIRIVLVVAIRHALVAVIRHALVAVIRLVLVVAVGLALVVRLHGRAWVGQRLRSITEIAERTHGGCCRGDDQTDNDVGEERGETRKHDRKQE
jgi:hypothetical protein